MKFITRRLHGWLDYIVALLLIVAPYLFGFANGGPEQRVTIGLGIATILYSLLTKYELGVFGIIPFPVHLILDILNGLFLASSPWLLGFANRVWAPHLVIGCVELVVISLTQVSASAPTAGTSSMA